MNMIKIHRMELSAKIFFKRIRTYITSLLSEAFLDD